MARAKTTYRAEARRRYRASKAAEADAAQAGTAEPGAGAPEAEAGARDAKRAAPSAARPAPGERPSLLTALRIAAAPADIRADLRAFPDIARRTKAVWLPAVVVIASGVALFISAFVQAPLLGLVGVVILNPPMIPSFLAGMLAPRASWLAGGIAGILGSVILAVLVFVAPSTTQTDRVSEASVLLTGVVFSFAVGAFAGFYRRFLALSAPASRQKRPAQKARARGR